MDHFFSGAHSVKMDEKNRFVLPHHFRYGLVENGTLSFSVGLGQGGCLAIYRQSDILGLTRRFHKLQYAARYQRFLTFFFSTLFHTECDKVGRIMIPSLLKKMVNMDRDIVVAGVLHKIEIWPQETYEKTLSAFLEGSDGMTAFSEIAEEAFTYREKQEEGGFPFIGEANPL